MRSAWIFAVVVMATGCASEDARPAQPSCRPDPHVPPPPADCPASVESCGVGDLDIRAWCKAGQVFTETPVTYDYCACGTTERACQLVVGLDPPPRLTCPGACLDEEIHVFDSYQQYSQFEPESLCAMPDAGPPDAAP